MKTSPTQRSLKRLRDAGYTVAVVEKWNQYAKVRQDLFGFLDLVALHPGVSGVIGIQTTTAAHMSERFQKIADEPRAALWYKCGNKIILHGWSKVGGRWALKACEVKIS